MGKTDGPDEVIFRAAEDGDKSDASDDVEGHRFVMDKTDGPSRSGQ